MGVNENPKPPSEDWLLVHRQVARAKEELGEAQHVEQFQAVGVLCREALISLAQAVYIPSKHKSPDGVVPSRTDAKRMLEAYVTTELAGDRHRYARRLAAAAIDLAVDLQHTRTADYEHAAMAVEATANVVSLISIASRRGDAKSTIAQLCERYIAEVNPRITHRYTLLHLAKTQLGQVVAAHLQPKDIIEYAKNRRQKVAAQTIRQHLIHLRGLLIRARKVWNLPVSPELLDRLRPELESQGLLAYSKARTRVPTSEELDRLKAYFLEQGKSAKTRIPMAEMSEFARWSARRINEICRLRWSDVNEEKRTCVVRGLIDGRSKKTWDHEFPLLGEAWEIIKRQPRTHDRIFPYNSRSASARYYEAKKALGITDLRFNDLRREAAKQLLKQGYPLEQVLKVVGRVDARSLMRELGLTPKPPPLTR